MFQVLEGGKKVKKSKVRSYSHIGVKTFESDLLWISDKVSASAHFKS